LHAERNDRGWSRLGRRLDSITGRRHSPRPLGGLPTPERHRSPLEAALQTQREARIERASLKHTRPERVYFYNLRTSFVGGVEHVYFRLNNFLDGRDNLGHQFDDSVLAFILG